MAGYDPSDSEERRVMKAHYFKESMISKGQSEADALRIASNYYHVPEESVRDFAFPDSPDPLDDDVWFLLGGHTPVAASEMLNEGDFY